jgi:hypothetical protein
VPGDWHPYRDRQIFLTSKLSATVWLTEQRDFRAKWAILSERSLSIIGDIASSPARISRAAPL